MRVRLTSAIAVIWCVALAAQSFGQNEPQFVATLPDSPAATSAKPAPPFTYVLFWKQNDANTKQFVDTIRNGTAKRADRADWTLIDVNDPANKAVVAKYGVSRAPMPLAICVANRNGAVTAVFTRRPNEEGLERALVTPAMIDVTKGLQDKKIVCVHVKPARETALPAGVADLVVDPTFVGRTLVVDVVANDSTEARFLKDMEFDATTVHKSAVVIMAPPGVLVGKFTANVTKDEITTKLHEAGKCCNDPNCKHNKKAQAR